MSGFDSFILILYGFKGVCDCGSGRNISGSSIVRNVCEYPMIYWKHTHYKKEHACLPCTSSFPVHIAMSSLHESRAHHLQTLSHAVYPSVAQKDENLKVPDQDYRGNGGAQSNQIWRLPPGFIDLCVGGHCHAESTCLLDSC